jgi:hypothetical protein
MILGHRYHGKTTLAEILERRFNFAFQDTTRPLKELTGNFIEKHPEFGISLPEFKLKFAVDKDAVRHVMVAALADYNKDDPARFIKDRFERSNIYAGCRSIEQYTAAKSIIDFTFWITDSRREEDDPTMEIKRTPDMVFIDNSGTKLQLESRVKSALYDVAGIPIRLYDKSLRDSLVSSMVCSPTNTLTKGNYHGTP